MQRMLVFFVALVSTLAFAATASAQKPGAHIVGDLTISKEVSGLTVSGRGAGFGNFVTSAFLTAQRVEAVFQCRNHGDNIAPGQGVEQVAVVGEPQIIEPQGGHIDFSPSLPAPPAPDPADVCPNPNWTVDAEPLSLTFIGVELVFEQEIEPGVFVEVLRVPLGDIDP